VGDRHPQAERAEASRRLTISHAFVRKVRLVVVDIDWQNCDDDPLTATNVDPSGKVADS
jgi:hypothetical protein